MKIYLKYFMIHLKSQMQYKTSFFLTLAGQFFAAFGSVVAIFFMFNRFYSVQGFTLSDSLLCFSVVGMGHALAETFARGFDLFPQMISNGEFDRVLVRPRGIIFQVLATKMDFTRLGKLLQSVAVLLFVFSTSEIVWTPDKVLTFILMVLASFVVFSGVFILYGAVSFFTIEGIEFMNILVYGGKEFGQHPYAIYGKGILAFLTFVVPLALFQYYPFLYLTGRETDILYMLAPLLGCLFPLPCYLVWRIGLRHYKSTGS